MHIGTFRIVAFIWVVTSIVANPTVEILNAQLPTGWKQHDWERARPAIVTPGASNLPLAPPSDAVILFDGTTLGKWKSEDGGPAKWIIQGDAMESVPGSGRVYSVDAFGDIQLHVEWAAPSKVEGKSQGRGNSGVFLQSLFEIQVLDSFDNITYADGQAGAVYGQYPPLVNVSRKPGEWQSYDIVFRRPHYDEDGKLTQSARITAFHNGVLVQDNVRPLGPTSWIQHPPYAKTADKLPLALQDHGNPVRYRNIWLRELPPDIIAQPTQPYDPVVVELSEQDRKKIVGRYERNGGGSWEISERDNKLYFHMISTPLLMIPHSPKEFGLKYTAATLSISYDEKGMATGLTFNMAGETSRAQRVK